ncbi:50S ribosomal protein L28 [Treponema zioleckii]|uniref:50S ribosomal protein L28 n=1 Tax=Treponema zioleckii TaxID=331680 RepID=UPI00168BA9EB|nr:50S ribosomal protein L28 [Treponema zioleckii]
MSRVCEICGKGSQHGNKVSKSYNHTRRQWRPNLLKIKTEDFGRSETLTICTRCLRSGFITKKINVVPANAGAPVAAN